jgi:endonuclease YncB( thermonuclease family)
LSQVLRFTRRRPLWGARSLAAAVAMAGAVAAYALHDTRAPSSQRFGVCGWATRQNCVVDGDTIWYEGLKIRLADIDAPEIRDPKCASEATLGHRAKRRLFELINSGPIEVVRTGRDEDRYRRKLRVVMQNGRSLGEVLVAEGLARRWDGARRSWCDASLTSRLVTARFETRLIGQLPMALSAMS